MKRFKEYLSDKDLLTYAINIHGRGTNKKDKSITKKDLTDYAINIQGRASKLKESISEEPHPYFSKDADHNSHLGKNSAEVIDKLARDHPIDSEHHAALNKYTANSSGLSREFLHAHKQHLSGKRYEMPDTIDNHDIKQLDRAMKSNRLKHDVVVHSGIGFDPSKAAIGTDSTGRYKVPLITHFSTSTASHIAEGFASDHDHKSENNQIHHKILRIHLKQGDPAVVIGKQKDSEGNSISNFANEDEVSLGRSKISHHEFRIDPKPKVIEHLGHVYHIHDAEYKHINS